MPSASQLQALQLPDQMGNQTSRVQRDHAQFDSAEVRIGSALDRVSVFGRNTLDFHPQFVGNLVPRSLVLPGALPAMIHTLKTLSWFWVPVILFSMNIVPNRINFTLQYAQQLALQTGGRFDTQLVVDIVTQLMTSGGFQLYPNEIMRNPVNGHHSLHTCCPYINSSAQDR